MSLNIFNPKKKLVGGAPLHVKRAETPLSTSFFLGLKCFIKNFDLKVCIVITFKVCKYFRPESLQDFGGNNARISLESSYLVFQGEMTARERNCIV